MASERISKNVKTAQVTVTTSGTGYAELYSGNDRTPVCARSTDVDLFCVISKTTSGKIYVFVLDWSFTVKARQTLTVEYSYL